MVDLTSLLEDVCKVTRTVEFPKKVDDFLSYLQGRPQLWKKALIVCSAMVGISQHFAVLLTYRMLREDWLEKCLIEDEVMNKEMYKTPEYLTILLEAKSRDELTTSVALAALEKTTYGKNLVIKGDPLTLMKDVGGWWIGVFNGY